MNSLSFPAHYPPAAEPRRWVSADRVTGHFVMWAVRQSPYKWPEGLQNAATEFRERTAQALARERDGILSGVSIARRRLYQVVYKVLLTLPDCQKWNTAKGSPDTEFVFTSAFSSNHPDYDIIDLDALAMNIARTVWNESAD